MSNMSIGPAMRTNKTNSRAIYNLSPEGTAARQRIRRKAGASTTVAFGIALAIAGCGTNNGSTPANPVVSTPTQSQQTTPKTTITNLNSVLADALARSVLAATLDYKYKATPSSTTETKTVTNPAANFSVAVTGGSTVGSGSLEQKSVTIDIYEPNEGIQIGTKDFIVGGPAVDLLQITVTENGKEVDYTLYIKVLDATFDANGVIQSATFEIYLGDPKDDPEIARGKHQTNAEYAKSVQSENYRAFVERVSGGSGRGGFHGRHLG